MTSGRCTCCGWKEIHGMQAFRPEYFDKDIKDLVIEGLAMDRNRGARCGAFLFTSAARCGGAAKFAACITERKLGKVIKLEKFVNANTKRIIKSYMWIPDQPALLAYITKLFAV